MTRPVAGPAAGGGTAVAGRVASHLPSLNTFNPQPQQS
jgi:hypothetical protein